MVAVAVGPRADLVLGRVAARAGQEVEVQFMMFNQGRYFLNTTNITTSTTTTTTTLPLKTKKQQLHTPPSLTMPPPPLLLLYLHLLRPYPKNQYSHLISPQTSTPPSYSPSPQISSPKSSPTIATPLNLTPPTTTTTNPPNHTLPSPPTHHLTPSTLPLQPAAFSCLTPRARINAHTSNTSLRSRSSASWSPHGCRRIEAPMEMGRLRARMRKMSAY